MGFLNPGNRSKRAKSGSPNPSSKKVHKRIKLNQKPHNIKTPKLPEPKRVIQTEPELELESTPEPEPEQEPLKPNASILERLPTEIVHEIFIFSRCLSLPFVSKILHDQLYPTKTLKKTILKDSIMDLNTGIVSPEMDHKKRFALDKDILKYKFVKMDLLEELKFDTVLPLSSIASESKNRLILYYDKLNQKLLETMRRAESTEEEINRELARIADENFNDITRGDVELEDVPEEEVQDFPEKYYNSPFNKDKLNALRYLHGKGLRFVDCNTIFKTVMESGISVSDLTIIYECLETDTITSVQPLIEAFETRNWEYIQWFIDTMDKEFLNNDDLWIYIYKTQDVQLLHYLEEQGGTPSHDVLGMLTTLG
ncbi:hypothetical protein BN7_6481 [Wickerhamomyces ciferrii]|uniref:Uncharacterized protein n=1 Tax=Wickerhamomyces ciferrii (strain ATCC 14091 / BCRC 22168 / CBS 111 / JCM 3599 / NBRC 0793 / NRRL Y-1031 F-60-10) TaxID=1206466 RepID=K0KZV6_WICCF|nr:uncharacterized protein BN7_6481 [Wickerhamomyces ciferrii]CCH46879.1 hypothetical protein BN7_6481 [Wickerhamomyces ciferrii]